MAFGSRSQLNREPNGKCCTTGNLDSTSALYILIIPCLQLVYRVHPHLHHKYLVNLGPAGLDARNIVEHWTVLPERALLHVVDEADGRKIEVSTTFPFHHVHLGNTGRVRRIRQRTFFWHSIRLRYSWSKLRRAENIGDERVIIESPHAVGTGGFQGIGFDNCSH